MQRALQTLFSRTNELRHSIAALGVVGGFVAAAIILTFGLLTGIYVPNSIASNKVTIEYTTIISVGFTFEGTTKGSLFTSNTAFGNVTNWKSVVQPNSVLVQASVTPTSLCSFLSIDSSGNVNLTKTGYYQGGVLIVGSPLVNDGTQQIYVFGMAPYISVNTANLASSFFGYPGFYGMPFVVPAAGTTMMANNSAIINSQPFQFYYNGTVPLPLSLQIFSFITQPNTEFGAVTVAIGIQRMDNVEYL